MVIKILSSAATFAGVSYNTNKIDRDKGELMRVSGFGPLQGLGKLRPEDYINYLKMVSVQNKRVKEPQFHAVISTKGRVNSKNELTNIAEAWLQLMGYGQQPYLIVYHKDTDNNHVHMVSSRIGKDGKKISSAFENIRAINRLNQVMGLDIKQQIASDIAKSLEFNFSTKAQWMMVLESMGYQVKEDGGLYSVFRYGALQEMVSVSTISDKTRSAVINKPRLAQLMAIFNKYGQQFSTELILETSVLPGGREGKTQRYTSEFAGHLKFAFGIELIFHAKNGQQSYGYTVIDYAGKEVYKGGEVMGLQTLLSMRLAHSVAAIKIPHRSINQLDGEAQSYYAALLHAIMYNYADVRQGLEQLGFELYHTANGYMLTDKAVGISIPVSSFATDDEMTLLEAAVGLNSSVLESYIPPISIADDVDDQQIHGMRRKRQQKARTNMR
jgi:hypothetical protein